MNRSKFLSTIMFTPAVAAGYTNDLLHQGQSKGLRRLSAESWFTEWRPNMEPAYHISIDETVLIEMSHGMPGLVTRDGQFMNPLPDSVINPMTGPIFIDGIEPGDSLAIDIFHVEPGEWGYCSGRIFEIRNGFAEFSPSLRLPVDPMIGGIGIAPEEGTVDTREPGETGGNIDCREIRAGSTVVFKARVKGALAGMGDSHALQGDGEITGQGIETDAEAIVRFRKLPESLSERPVIIRPESLSTIGAARHLEDAAWQATEDMIALLQKRSGITGHEARLLIGLTGNLRINQIVDPSMGARMEVPSWIFGI